MLDHEIPLRCLEVSFGLTSLHLLSFCFYLDPSQMAFLGDSHTSWVPIPQGSVFILCSLLINIYPKPLDHLFLINSLFQSIGISQWMSSNRFSLNYSRTLLLWLSICQQLSA